MPAQPLPLGVDVGAADVRVLELCVAMGYGAEAGWEHWVVKKKKKATKKVAAKRNMSGCARAWKRIYPHCLDGYVKLAFRVGWLASRGLE